MIWGDIAAVLNSTYAGAQGVYFGVHGNPGLMNAIAAVLGVSVVPELRTDSLYFDGGVTGLRFVSSKNHEGRRLGYVCLAIVNGAAVVLVRSDRLGAVREKYFFRTDAEAAKFVSGLRSRGAIAVGARVQFEVLDLMRGLPGSATAKLIAYTKLRAATADKFQASRTKSEFDAAALASNMGAGMVAARVQAEAWLVDATARHAAALAAYQALGGLGI